MRWLDERAPARRAEPHHGPRVLVLPDRRARRPLRRRLVRQGARLSRTSTSTTRSMLPDSPGVNPQGSVMALGAPQRASTSARGARMTAARARHRRARLARDPPGRGARDTACPSVPALLAQPDASVRCLVASGADAPRCAPSARGARSCAAICTDAGVARAVLRGRGGRHALPLRRRHPPHARRRASSTPVNVRGHAQPARGARRRAASGASSTSRRTRRSACNRTPDDVFDERRPTTRTWTTGAARCAPRRLVNEAAKRGELETVDHPAALVLRARPAARGRRSSSR